IRGESYYITWEEDAFKDATGHAAAAVSDPDTLSFLAGGDLTGTVAEVEALSEDQLKGATSITVRDTAQAISDADFSEGNLAYVQARTITFAESDIPLIPQIRLATVTIDGQELVKLLVSPSSPYLWTTTIGNATDMASAVAKALKARLGNEIDDQAVTAQNGVVTLSNELGLGQAAISVTYNSASTLHLNLPGGNFATEGEELVFTFNQTFIGSGQV